MKLICDILVMKKFLNVEKCNKGKSKLNEKKVGWWIYMWIVVSEFEIIELKIF